MFKDAKAFSSFSVNDVAVARRFYTQTLGFAVDEPMGMLLLRIAGGNPVLVYGKRDHVPATYTVLNIPVSDVEAAVDQLVARGVRFERYDGPDVRTDARGIQRGRGPAIAWFKDPAGNIVSVIDAKAGM